MSQQNKIIVAIAALIAIGGLVAILQPRLDDTAQIVENDASPTAQAVAALASGNSDPLETPNPLGEIVLGAADAPITMIEYGALTCGHCGDFHRGTLPTLKEKYVDTGLMKIYFRPFPLNEYGTAGAMLAQCVTPNARVHFLDSLFLRQATWLQSKDPMDALQGYARQAGLSEADFVVCLRDRTRLEGIRAMQSAAAEQLGVSSTPTFFINGTKLEGNLPLKNFEKIIKPMLP